MEKRKSSRIEQYRQEREPGTVPGLSLQRPARGNLNAGRREGNSPLQCDMLMINPPLKGLNSPVFRMQEGEQNDLKLQLALLQLNCTKFLDYGIFIP
jgi:hypothetical protein